MAASPAEAAADQPPAAAEFEAFDRFPWSKHRAFLLGLIDTLGGAAALRPNPTHEGSAAFCRTVFFRRQTACRVDLVRYGGFLATHPAYPSVDRRLLRALYAAAADLEAEGGEGTTSAELGLGKLSLEQTTADTPGTPNGHPGLSPSANRGRRIAEAVAAGPLINAFDGTPTPAIVAEAEAGAVPSWQRSAPKSELVVPRSSAAAAVPQNGGEAPYSDKFAAIVEAIQTGKQPEGIRQIPDTVVRQAGITPLGKLTAPRKPWEMAAGASAASALSFLAGGEPAGEGQKEQEKEGEKQASTAGGLPLVDAEFPPPPPSPPGEVDGKAQEESEDAQQ